MIPDLAYLPFVKEIIIVHMILGSSEVLQNQIVQLVSDPKKLKSFSKLKYSLVTNSYQISKRKRYQYVIF